MDKKNKSSGLRQQALMAAYRVCGGDLNKNFTAEDILIEAWKQDKAAWGLRGHEQDYPDPEKINKELNRRGKIGLVGQGLIKRVGPMIYRMTTTGLHEVTLTIPNDYISREKVERELELSIKDLLEHPAFKSWLSDETKPCYFKDAGHFWGISPGTPPKTVRERVFSVYRILNTAKEILDMKQIDSMNSSRSSLLFDRDDINRCLEFQEMLINRFKKDLVLLDPQFPEINAKINSRTSAVGS
jgi:hypothetical protein